jgi:hypothetical protein
MQPSAVYCCYHCFCYCVSLPLQVQFCISDAAVQLPELRSIGLPSQLLLAAHAAWSQALSGQRLTPFHKEVHDALLQVGPCMFTFM